MSVYAVYGSVELVLDYVNIRCHIFLLRIHEMSVHSRLTFLIADLALLLARIIGGDLEQALDVAQQGLRGGDQGVRGGVAGGRGGGRGRRRVAHRRGRGRRRQLALALG